MATEVASEPAIQCLRFHLTKGLGPRRFTQLFDHCGSLDAMRGISAGAMEGLHGIGRKIANRIADGRETVDVDSELALAEQHGVRILCRFDEGYPPLLLHTSDPPICLYVKGTLQPNDATSLAIVGSRRCSYYGQEQARGFAFQFAQLGMTIVSGLARGIDTCAHLGALDATGRTVAVLGCGLATIYPPENESLAERIRESGALISELPMETAPDRLNFPGRNRIIAGATLGTLVVEGTRNSGALITAYHAIDANREVFAVPGQIDSPFSEGPHYMITRQHAKLVTGRDDVLEELGDVGRVLTGHIEPEKTEAETPTLFTPLLDESEQKVADALDTQPCHLDELIQRTELSVARVASALINLQLKGLAKQLPGSFYVKGKAMR